MFHLANCIGTIAAITDTDNFAAAVCNIDFLKSIECGKISSRRVEEVKADLTVLHVIVLLSAAPSLPSLLNLVAKMRKAILFFELTGN